MVHPKISKLAILMRWVCKRFWGLVVCDVSLWHPNSWWMSRSFMLQRILSQKSFGKSILFFGCRRRDQDYLYGNDLEKWARAGHMELFTAFSREQVCFCDLTTIWRDHDIFGIWPHLTLTLLCQGEIVFCTILLRGLCFVQKKKVYVQNRVSEEGEKVWDLLEAGGHFYVCGDASSMAGAVEESLLQIIEGHQVCLTTHVRQFYSQIIAPALWNKFTRKSAGHLSLITMTLCQNRAKSLLRVKDNYSLFYKEFLNLIPFSREKDSFAANLQEGGPTGARQYLQTLQSQGRYQRDVWYWAQILPTFLLLIIFTFLLMSYPDATYESYREFEREDWVVREINISRLDWEQLLFLMLMYRDEKNQNHNWQPREIASCLLFNW